MSLQNHDKHIKKQQNATKQKKLNIRKKETAQRGMKTLFQFHLVSHVIHTTPGRSQTWGWYNNHLSNVLSNCFIYGLLSGIYCPDRTTTLINTQVLHTGPQTLFLRFLMFKKKSAQTFHKGHWVKEIFIRRGWVGECKLFFENHISSLFSILVMYCKMYFKDNQQVRNLINY